ncbi:MAG: peroxide stress protein YaaA [Acidimicrobiales bacterium]
MSLVPFVLLPPSEGKVLGGGMRTRRGVFDDLLVEQRSSLITSLAAISGDRGALERLTRLSGALLDRAGDALERVVAGDAPVLPTWRRYNGVVWTHLDPTTLKSTQRRRILVPSALYGVTAGEDPIADYRLTFHASLADCGPLTSYWREPVTDALVHVVGRHPVVDLLPTEHRRVVDMERLAASTSVITVSFQSADGAKPIGHAAKAVKGVLARRLLVEGVTALSSFAWDSWRGAMLDENTVTVTAHGT